MLERKMSNSMKPRYSVFDALLIIESSCEGYAVKKKHIDLFDSFLRPLVSSL